VGPSRSTLSAPVSRRRTAFLACLLPLVGAVFFATAARAVTWAEIRQRGVLRWGNDAEGGAPYIYHDPQRPETLTGFEVDLAGALTAKLGVGSAFVQQNWDMLIPALGDGTSFDIIIAGLERSPENLAKIAMSRPYLSFGQQLVVRADPPLATSLDTLKGRPVGVLSGTVSYRILEARGDLDVRVYQDNVNYFRDLEIGRLDAVLTDTPIAQVNLAGNAKLRRAGPPFAPGSYAIGVRREDSALLPEIDRAIEALLADGTLERIYSKYGLWTAEQAGLRGWKAPEEGPAKAGASTLRGWRTYLPILLGAAVTTVWVTCAGMAIAVVWGLALALLRADGPAVVRWGATVYVEVFRGTPLLLQIYFIYFGLAQQLGIKLGAGVAAVVALGLNYAANEAENYRAGIEAVPKGQSEAAMALGMTRWTALRRVVLPQALRISLPSVTNDFIAMSKDSSIVSVIGLVELTKQYQIRAIDTSDYIGLGVMTGGIYLAMSHAASVALRRLERSLR